MSNATERYGKMLEKMTGVKTVREDLKKIEGLSELEETNEQIKAAVKKSLDTSASASEIDDSVTDYQSSKKVIDFISEYSCKPSTFNPTGGGTVIGNTVTVNAEGSQSKITIASNNTEIGKKYLLIANIENMQKLVPEASCISFHNHSQGLTNIYFDTWDKKLVVHPFTSSINGTILQALVLPSKVNNYPDGTPLASFDTNFIGFIEWTQELEDYWTNIANDETIDFSKLQNKVSLKALNASVANYALNVKLPESSFENINSLANREGQKQSDYIIGWDSTSGVESSYSTFDGSTFNCGAVVLKTTNPSARGWFGFDVKPENYSAESKTYVFVFEGVVTATNVKNVFYTTAVGFQHTLAQDIVDNVETSIKTMYEVTYDAGVVSNQRYTYINYDRNDSNIDKLSFDFTFTTFAIFEKVDGFSVDDYILANKIGITSPLFSPRGTATEEYVNTQVESVKQNAYKLSPNDFKQAYDIEMFLSGGQSLNVGGSASSSNEDWKNVVSFAASNCVYPFDLSTQVLRDTFFGTELVPITESGTAYPPLCASTITLLRLLEEENRVDLNAFGSTFFPFIWGVNGNSITLHEKGTDAYGIMLEAVTKGKEFANKQGKTFGVRVMNWYQGEADSGQTYQWYYDKLSQLFIDVNTDVKAITGQSEDIQFFTYQTSAWLDRLQPDIDIQEAQVAVANDYANVHLCGAMYQFSYSDTFHPSDRAVVGLQTGVAIKRVVYDNETWTDFKPVSHQVITDGTNYYTHLKFDVPVKPARFDISGDAWHNPRGKEVNYGFELLLDGVEKQTAEPFITKGDTVVLTSSENPVGMTIRYAVNGHEGGGNLCDSQNVVIRNKNIDYVIDNFAVSFSNYIVS